MKKGKKYFLLFCGCLVASVCFINYYYNDIKPVKPAVKTVGQPMETAFDNSKAIFVEAKLQGWAKINDYFSGQEELLMFGSQAENILGLKEPVIRKQTSDQGFNSLIITGQVSEKLETEIIFQTLTGTKDKDETYLIINMVDFRGPDFIDISKEKMRSVFLFFHQEPEINQLMIGFREGELTKKSFVNTINSIFSSVGGKISGEAEDENYFSVTGYLPGIEEKLKVGQEDVNIQIAASYDQLEDKTYIYIGSPLVFSDY